MMGDMRERLVGRFREVLVERMERLYQAFEEVRARPSDSAAATVVKREVHTVKGEARMAGFKTTSHVAHEIEDLLKGVGVEALSTARCDAIYSGFELIGLLASRPPDTAETDPAVLAWRACCAEALDGTGAPRALAPVPVDTASRAVAQAPKVRIDPDRFEHLSRSVGEIVGQIERHESILEALREEIRVHRRALPALKDHLQALEDAAVDLSMSASELEERVNKLRFVPLSSLLERFPLAVRDIADEQGKLVQVQILADAVEMDERVIDRVSEPLLHLVRNGVDHGVEYPEDRGRTDKPLRATIRLSAAMKGSDVEIVISDDGCGIDVAEVRAALVWRGDLAAEEAMLIPPEEILDRIFDPEFSTRTDVTILSGRGVGLAIVRDTLAQLGGTVRVQTTYGSSTTFTLRIPTSVVLERVLILRTGRFYAALRTDALVPECPYGSVPRFELSELLGLPMVGAMGGEVVHVCHKGKTLALMVDEIIGMRRALQRPLGPFLRGMQLYHGSVVVAHGAPAMMLSIGEVFRLARRSAGVATPLPSSRRVRVLVVDDSKFTRELVVDVFDRMGFEVAEAEDGRRGVDRFQDAGADLIVTDLDMPVMDGFGLIEAVRAQDRRVPIAVFTTRGTPEDRARATDLGANAFLVKTEFRERQLHDLVGQYVSRD